MKRERKEEEKSSHTEEDSYCSDEDSYWRTTEQEAAS